MDSINLPLQIDVSPEIKALFDRGVYEFDDYFRDSLIDQLEVALRRVAADLVRQTYDDVRRSMDEING